MEKPENKNNYLSLKSQPRVKTETSTPQSIMLTFNYEEIFDGTILILSYKKNIQFRATHHTIKFKGFFEKGTYREINGRVKGFGNNMIKVSGIGTVTLVAYNTCQ